VEEELELEAAVRIFICIYLCIYLYMCTGYKLLGLKVLCSY